MTTSSTPTSRFETLRAQLAQPWLGALLLALALAAPTAGANETELGCPEPAARGFDFWLGEWDVLNKRLLQDEGWSPVGTATVRVHPILGGCGVVEHWEGSLGTNWLTGFSMRTWDVRTQTWELVLSWPAPHRPGFSTLEGTFTHGRGEFFAQRSGPEGEVRTERYTFSDIRPDAFRWDGASSEDGARWHTYWIMEFSRRPAGSQPLFNGPWVVDRRSRRCSQDEVAALDFLAGRWLTADDTGDAVRVRTVPIVGGCAQIELTTALDGRETRFAARSWDLRAERFVEYALVEGRPGFIRFEGGFEDGVLVLESTPRAATAETGRRWQRSYRESGEGVELTTGLSDDGGESWRETGRYTLQPTDLTAAPRAPSTSD